MNLTLQRDVIPIVTGHQRVKLAPGFASLTTAYGGCPNPPPPLTTNLPAQLPKTRPLKTTSGKQSRSSTKKEANTSFPGLASIQPPESSGIQLGYGPLQ
jgi:hypothetical protein